MKRADNLRLRNNSLLALFYVQFVSAATDICEMLHDAGFWADFLDPASGRPVSLCCDICSVTFSPVIQVANENAYLYRVS